MAFASQTAWIRNATIRDNVLFFRAFCETKYRRALHAACLDQDLDQFEFADRTQVLFLFLLFWHSPQYSVVFHVPQSGARGQH